MKLSTAWWGAGDSELVGNQVRQRRRWSPSWVPGSPNTVPEAGGAASLSSVGEADLWGVSGRTVCRCFARLEA